MNDFKIWSWEIKSNFEEDFDEKKLREKFEEEFPNAKKRGFVYFLKMISFNGAEGRKHRYLIVQNIGCFEKQKFKNLPRTLGYFGNADKYLRANEGFENSFFIVREKEKLIFMLFMEGRLCYWSEEIYNDLTFENRVEFFKKFLENDELYARVKKYQCVFVDAEPEVHIAEKDSFFKPLLQKKEWQRPLFFSSFFLGFFLLLFFYFVNFWGENLHAKTLYLNAIPIELDKPEIAIEKSEIRFVIEKRNEVKITTKEKKCLLPPLKIQGIIAGKMFYGMLGNNEKRWIKKGEFWENFEVKNVLKDKIQLSCGGNLFDILMEEK